MMYNNFSIVDYQKSEDENKPEESNEKSEKSEEENKPEESNEKSEKSEESNEKNN